MIGTMNGSSTWKPRMTSTARSTTVMSRLSQGAETKSSITLPSDQARGVGDDHGDGEQRADDQAQVAAQAQIGRRELGADAAMFIQPEHSEADHEQRQSALPADQGPGGPDDRGEYGPADPYRAPGQLACERQAPVDRAYEGEHDGSVRNGNPLGQLTQPIVRQQCDAEQTQDERHHARVADDLRGGVETRNRPALDIHGAR